MFSFAIRNIYCNFFAGLTAECLTYVDAVLYAANTTAVDIIVPNENFEMIINTTKFFKFYVPEFVDHAFIVVNSAHLQTGGNVTLRIDAKRLPSVNNTLTEFVLNYTEAEDVKPYSKKFWTSEDNWHYLEITSTFVSINFHLKFITTVDDAIPYIQTLTLKNYTKLYRSSLSKLHRTDTLSEMIPYKQYNLVKVASSESFLYSYDLRVAIDSPNPPINLTTSDFTVLKFIVQKGTDSGGSLQFSLAFSPKVKTYNEHQVIVGCVRRDVREIPQYPNKCYYNGRTTDAPVFLNKTTENSTIYIPYPEPGIWYASFRLFDGVCETCNCSVMCNDDYVACTDYCDANCLDSSECDQCPLLCKERVLHKSSCKQCDCIGGCVNPEVEESNSSLQFDVSSYPCLAGKCGKNGRCVYMVSGGYVYTICVCSNNYRGKILCQLGF